MLVWAKLLCNGDNKAFEKFGSCQARYCVKQQQMHSHAMQLDMCTGLLHCVRVPLTIACALNHQLSCNTLPHMPAVDMYL